MTLDGSLLTVGASAGAAILASLITILTTKIAAGPGEEDALTKRFTALAEREALERDHLERKIEKLERNVADLEVYVIHANAWADEVQIIARNRRVDLPPRPKFSHFNGHAE